jgi:hypothetical protein
MFSFTPRPFYPPERTPVPTKKEAGWAPEPVWNFGREGKYIAPTAIRKPCLPGPWRSHYTEYAIPTPVKPSVHSVTSKLVTWSFSLFIRLRLLWCLRLAPRGNTGAANMKFQIFSPLSSCSGHFTPETTHLHSMCENVCPFRLLDFV